MSNHLNTNTLMTRTSKIIPKTVWHCGYLGEFSEWFKIIAENLCPPFEALRSERWMPSRTIIVYTERAKNGERERERVRTIVKTDSWMCIWRSKHQTKLPRPDTPGRGLAHIYFITCSCTDLVNEARRARFLSLLLLAYNYHLAFSFLRCVFATAPCVISVYVCVRM